MSTNVNVTRPEARKNILLVAANPAVSETTGWPVGFWWAELTHPFWVFTEAGYEIEIRSPRGGALVADSYSDPEDASGYSAQDNPACSVKPAMMFCGDDAAAKHIVGELIAQLGWEPLDVGGLEQALHLEHMTLLWVRMVRVTGASPHMVWARLRR